MNNQRRKKVTKIIEKISALESLMSELKEAVEEIREEEQECLDNIPENLMGTERYEATELAVENLESAFCWFESADTEELTGYLEEAMQ